MGTTTLGTRQLNRALLARQLLLKRKRIPVADVVHAVGGLQSQEPKDPFVALWSRISGAAGRRLRARRVEHQRDTARIEVQLFERSPKATIAELSHEAEGLVRFMEPDATEFLIDVT